MPSAHKAISTITMAQSSLSPFSVMPPPRSRRTAPSRVPRKRKLAPVCSGRTSVSGMKNDLTTVSDARGPACVEGISYLGRGALHLSSVAAVRGQPLHPFSLARHRQRLGHRDRKSTRLNSSHIPLSRMPFFFLSIRDPPDSPPFPSPPFSHSPLPPFAALRAQPLHPFSLARHRQRLGH